MPKQRAVSVQRVAILGKRAKRVFTEAKIEALAAEKKILKAAVERFFEEQSDGN